jgi:hypothetical protein
VVDLTRRPKGFDGANLNVAALACSGVAVSASI